jgi:hypothetical protein
MPVLGHHFLGALWQHQPVFGRKPLEFRFQAVRVPFATGTAQMRNSKRRCCPVAPATLHPERSPLKIARFATTFSVYA